MDDCDCRLTVRQSMRYAEDLARLYQLEKERDEDLRSGAQMQQRFLTPAWKVAEVFAPVGYEVALLNRAPDTISGDFYCPKAVDGLAAGFLLADACGHGLAAALISMRVSSLVQTADASAASPAGFLNHINQDIKGLRMADKFVTANYTVFHSAGCTLANAGQPYPLLLRNGKVHEVAVAGPPMGMVAAPVYREVACAMEPGDVLVLYTDGVTEAYGPDNEFYGQERLTESLRAHARKPLASLLRSVAGDVQAFSGGPLEDDVTLAAFCKQPEAKA
jgi:sigma-B regulation protein RsbU (phosphoserine phosphatase)